MFRSRVLISSKNLKSQNTRVVYHLHKQTGRYTVWANGKKNSGLESGLSFAQISSAETGMKHNFWLMEHEFLEHSVRKTGLTFPMFSCSQKFSTGTTRNENFL